MAHRIEVALLDDQRDAAGEKVARRIRADLGIDTVERVRCCDVYTIAAALDDEQLRQVAGAPLSDPVIQRASIDTTSPDDCDWVVEVALRPGVTDNVGRTAAEAIALALDRPWQADESVHTSRQYRLWGRLTAEQVQNIARQLLANELIQTVRLLPGERFRAQGGFAATVPRVTSSGRPPVQFISLDGEDAELLELSRRRVLALNLAELHAIRDYYRRPEVVELRRRHGLPARPSDVELEALAQTWSEHCKHKIFNARIRYREAGGAEQVVDSLFDTYIRGATAAVRRQLGDRDYCLSVFVDNAGVVRFDDDWSLVFKVETHNSPSALDPYGGALTGIVGVNRDPFGTGMGARLIFNTDVFCLANPFRSEPVPRGLLHPRRVLEGVREGVEHGGNKSGIPTINGSVVFDERYLGKPLVYCGTGGLLPARLHGRPGHLKAARPADRIVMVGGRIGADGIHGATFSSEELHEGSPATAVQIGDPITQKRLTDFLLRARDEGLYSCITDNGAGGLSSSVGEMAREPGGCHLDLSNAPLKYQGLAPWEILLSEAQERMTVAVPPERLERFLELARLFQVEATDLGQFDSSGLFRVDDGGRCVALLEMEFFHEGVPRLELEARWEPADESPPRLDEPESHGRLLRELLGRLNVCSKEYWVRQYDHEVQAGTVVKPLVGARDDGPSDAAVFRPLLDSPRAVVVSHGICPRYSDIDTEAMAAAALDEAVRNAVCVGADPERLAALDNFCWCDPVLSEKNPDGDFKLGQLVRACRGLYQACLAYGIPLISGKDSMKNDAVIEGRRISIPPTLLVSLLGLLDDAGRAVTMDAKQPGHLVYLAGLTRAELGASELFGHLGLRGGRVPRPRLEQNRTLYRALHRALWSGLVASCHDLSDGGLGVALAETALAGELGLEVELAAVPAEDVGSDSELLYSESCGRLLVTVPAERAADFERELAGCALARIGTVVAEPRLHVTGRSGAAIIDEPLDELRRAWQRPLAFAE